MTDYYNDPPEQPEVPECCDHDMSSNDRGDCFCEICGSTIVAPPDIEPIDDYPACMVSLVYGGETTRERQLEQAMHDLWRNHPEHPSTFGPCRNPKCIGHGRGSGLCKFCITECIGEITGDRQAATALRLAIADARSASSRLRDLVVPPAG